MDFIALDFETANSRADSACQLAMVVVQGGQIVDEHCWLVRPPRMYFSPRNIMIHGIQPDHVQRAPNMQQLWPQIQPLVDGQLLVAHNAGFDIGVLVASLAAFDIACPYLEFSCTRAIARSAWPGRSRYGLKPLGTWLGIDFKHHDALEDARCCALIALAAAKAYASDAISSFADFEQRLRLSRGKYSLGRVSGPKAIGRRPLLRNATSLSPPPAHALRPHAHVQPGLSLATDAPATAPSAFHRARTTSRGAIDPLTIIDAAAGSRPLAGKSIVCLGTLRGLTLDETRILIEALGGQLQTTIGPHVNYVIACGGVLLEDANQMLCTHAPEPAAPTIRVLSERQFLALLPAGKAAVRW